MTIIIPIQYIEKKPHSSQYRIVGKGITVTFLACLLNDPEWTVTRISEEYGLTPAEIHAAWSFYYDHKDEIDPLLEDLAMQDTKDNPDNQHIPLYKRYLEITSHKT